ncbi:hypothetical protein [Candidatus Methylobacter oryzae]|uniref:Uncharacterized protein n=1 Tax=Candidatus Methylobacter oryzae TaxID=2497749 RepID=A0ABY3CDI9_9GAMM|nr:hypothetical protein [Candidatus Methylobacter oryzae]TRX00700.1 hypothetical protein EKO24_005105 [Candidatus Methylobacter oryzae]
MNIALIGAAIALMATLGGIVMIRRKASQQPIHVKIVLFGLYFWGLAFLQLLIFALAYHWIKA